MIYSGNFYTQCKRSPDYGHALQTVPLIRVLLISLSSKYRYCSELLYLLRAIAAFYLVCLDWASTEERISRICNHIFWDCADFPELYSKDSSFWAGFCRIFTLNSHWSALHHPSGLLLQLFLNNGVVLEIHVCIASIFYSASLQPWAVAAEARSRFLKSFLVSCSSGYCHYTLNTFFSTNILIYYPVLLIKKYNSFCSSIPFTWLSILDPSKSRTKAQWYIRTLRRATFVCIS